MERELNFRFMSYDIDSPKSIIPDLGVYDDFDVSLPTIEIKLSLTKFMVHTLPSSFFHVETYQIVVQIRVFHLSSLFSILISYDHCKPFLLTFKP